MELPDPRGFRAEDKTSSHDFLSLYREPSSHLQDPRSPSQDAFAKTHDFFHPIEGAKCYNSIESNIEMSKHKLLPQQHMPTRGDNACNVNHNSSFDQGTRKLDGHATKTSEVENKVANGINHGYKPYHGNTFTIWEESILKDKANAHPTSALSEKIGYWSVESQSHIPHDSNPDPRDGGLTSLASSRQQQSGKQKDQGFMEMIAPIGCGFPENDVDRDDFPKKEHFYQIGTPGDAGGRCDGSGNDQRATTPRSKHSATEQRRRSKINDRFQILRELIPHSDQKRDKASFLLEVIEYIQFLQEKVHKYENTFPGWSQETGSKLMPWKQNHITDELVNEHSRTFRNGLGPGAMLGKLDENSLAVSAALLATAQSMSMSESDMSTGPSYKPAEYDQSGLTNKVISVPPQQQQHNQQSIYNSPVIRGTGCFSQPAQRLIADTESMTQQWQRPSDSESDLLEQEELTIEGGTIRMSSIYYQGLLSSFANALQSSGIDLSQASISVQVDIGKRAQRASTSAKDLEDPTSSLRSRVVSSTDDSILPPKRIRTDTS